MLDSGAPVDFREDAFGVQLKVPETKNDDPDRVVVLELGS
jgi:hypothetical protein